MVAIGRDKRILRDTVNRALACGVTDWVTEYRFTVYSLLQFKNLSKIRIF